MISKITLQNYRNFKKKEIKFDEGITVIVGPNASGKTNILESIFFLATGKSFKSSKPEECVNHDEEVTRITGKGSAGQASLEIVLTRGFLNIGKGAPEKVAKKRLLVNGSGKRMVDFSNNFNVVLFVPRDLDLVTQSPSLRRKFLDTVLSQVDREYKRSIASYEKGVRQRNKLLYRIREDMVHNRKWVSRSHLLFWNQLLIKNGDYISRAREEFIEFVNSTNKINDEKYSLVYDKSAISEERLESYKNEEVASATTLVGPHRDDFIFQIQNKKIKPLDLSSYGSRGEQRMGVLWLKIAELSFMKVKSEIIPTLLLDDIFSELDHEHRSIVMEKIKDQQTIMTTADEHFVENFSKSDIIRL
ncbi:DNA replication and repair protein RecF [Candidatus Microgenomates bacterium]|nr:DNA replication and repair protein RecF [Candidatus Microgenomates bacterium]